jgi:hypothetical protein
VPRFTEKGYNRDRKSKIENRQYPIENQKSVQFPIENQKSNIEPIPNRKSKIEHRTNSQSKIKNRTNSQSKIKNQKSDDFSPAATQTSNRLGCDFPSSPDYCQG